MSGSLGGARGSGWVRVVALATAVAVLPAFGCSYVFLERPRDDYKPYEKINCTTSYALPTADLVLALLHIASIAILASAKGDAFGGDKNRQTLAQGDIFWMLMNGTSSAWGFYKVGECRELVAEDQGVRMPPVHVAPRPRPRRIESPPPASPAPAIEPVQPPPDQPASGPGPAAAPAPAAAPVPQLPRVPQKTDED